MSETNNRILGRMLDRLFATIANGPSLNCRPHSSRQRVDLTQIARLKDLSPEQVLQCLLGDEAAVKLSARVPPPPKPANAEGRDSVGDGDSGVEGDDESRAARQAWSDQQSLLSKLRTITEDARTYEQDTGVHVLNVGFPLLSLPSGSGRGGRGATTRRVVAPIAFIPVSLTVRQGPAPFVEIACKGDGIDRVVANSALLAWLEQQAVQAGAELTGEEQDAPPWAEISVLVQHVCKTLSLAVPDLFAGGERDGSPSSGPERSGDDELSCDRVKDSRPFLQSAPRADDEQGGPSIISAAVLGLFPMANQGLLRDMQAMTGGDSLSGPVESFIQVDVSLDRFDPTRPPEEPVRRMRVFDEERLVAPSDPCQTRAVRLAREARGLVIHGPPGTGKSQTITNIIGDHLSRGQRVLLVCDKRSALDVVASRLEHMGLARFCALIHDPQRDQRELYRSIREQLEALTEARTSDRAERRLAKIDSELQKLHAELSQYRSSLMEPRRDGSPSSRPEFSGDDELSSGASRPFGQGFSFHDLMGEWLDTPDIDSVEFAEADLEAMNLDCLEEHALDIHDILERAREAGYATNPWNKHTDMSLGDFLARPMDQFRAALSTCILAARDVDATAHAKIPPFAAQADLADQGRARQELAEALDDLLRRVNRDILSHWAQQPVATIRQERQKLAEAEPLLDMLQATPPNAELAAMVRQNPLDLSTVNQQLSALRTYLQTAGKWYGVFCFRRRAGAAGVAACYGMPLSVEEAQRLQASLATVRARMVISDLCHQLFDEGASPLALPDDTLERMVRNHLALFDLLLRVHDDPLLQVFADQVRAVLVEPAGAATLLEGLQKSALRAAAMNELEQSLARSGLFRAASLSAFSDAVRKGQPIGPTIKMLAESLVTVEGVLRVRHGLAQLLPPIRPVVERLVESAVVPQEGITALRKATLNTAIRRRLREDPRLQAVDGQRLKTLFQRYLALDEEKRAAVREVVVHRWVTAQKGRLLASTGTRLSSLGADLRRRLVTRGHRAMRLRQIIQIGQALDRGDPLFDLRPVWLASPETVAQIFPRSPLFDVVIFDEASQCRLEEALPVLTRGRRVVIAGDPRQLPPTRFFETALTVSDDEEIENDQQLFEIQQGEIEDLLEAALNIEIQQCYLDVHYRSRNADLIEFSNECFYNDRLQAIPGHPSNRTRFSPITLYRVNGIYDRRSNVAEADQVCRIVHDLLRRAEPPSIGIACFNLQQRDVIVDRLDELAEEDREFGARLAEARTRRGAGSFEGLFVKNLENVQGDERDHIIISTTYGPDPQGRFYRRFGPLGRAGGGRRLNVLVTRARQEVHLVTSIPPSAYRSAPPLAAGQIPGGGWLLFAYISYAERLAEHYQAAHERLEAEAPGAVDVHVRSSRSPSRFAEALASRLAEGCAVSSEVHWGNDGFCVDIACRHPSRAEDVSIGILCDVSRFAQAEDLLEWDIFRTAIHEGQGWRLHRLWTPHFFRDPQGCIEAILRDVEAAVSNQQDPDALPVIQDGEDAQNIGAGDEDAEDDQQA